MTVQPATPTHWPTRTLQRTFGAIPVQLEVIENFDVILGSDLLYESQQVSSLTRCIRKLVAPGDTVVMAAPGRNHIQSAVDQLSCAGFDSTISIINETFVLTLSISA